MSRRCLVLGIALLLPGLWAQAETNRYKQRQAEAAPAAYLEAGATPAALPGAIAASAGPIQQVGFHHGGGGCASCNGGGGYGFVGECCQSMPYCARGAWDSYCGDKANWHARMHGCGRGCGHGCHRGCGGGCGSGCGGCCFLPARGAPPLASCCGCGAFRHGKFRGAYMSDCGCGAEPSCGCNGGDPGSVGGLAPLPSPVAGPHPADSASRSTFGDWPAGRLLNIRASRPVGFVR